MWFFLWRIQQARPQKDNVRQHHNLDANHTVHFWDEAKLSLNSTVALALQLWSASNFQMDYAHLGVAMSDTDLHDPSTRSLGEFETFKSPRTWNTDVYLLLGDIRRWLWVMFQEVKHSDFFAWRSCAWIYSFLTNDFGTISEEASEGHPNICGHNTRANPSKLGTIQNTFICWFRVHA